MSARSCGRPTARLFSISASLPRMNTGTSSRIAGTLVANARSLVTPLMLVFTILLTRRDADKERDFNWTGVGVALAVFGALIWAVLKTSSLAVTAPAIEPLTVRQIGEVLMTDYVWALQCIGILLTAALLGAVVLVMEEKR